MEHSLLHTLQLLGLVVATAGPLLVLLLARGLLGTRAVQQLPDRWRRTSRNAASIGAAAVALDVFVQVAEAEGRTVFGGVELAQVAAFLSTTTVGHLAVLRVACFLLAALALVSSARPAWWLSLLACLGATVATAWVSHAAAQPTGREFALMMQILHLLAVAGWMGVLLHWWTSRHLWLSADNPTFIQCFATLLGRFSPWALVLVSLLFVSGVAGVVRFVSSPPDLLFSAYGLTLTLKLLLLLPVFWAGYVNFRFVVPALRRASAGAAPLAGRFVRTLELEVTAGVLVIAVAGIVGSVSPPGEDGGVTLTSSQIAAITSPRFPEARLVDPSTFVGAAERNVFDLKYSEFMHNWSGVLVIVMGMLWWMQSAGGTSAEWASKAWPFVLLPFAAFISYFADPEVFVLRQVTLWEAVSDPVVLEHQIGALLVLVLVWLGRKDSARPKEQRPLGPALPVLMIFGSLLLLGHAHSSVRSTQELTNLINVQHAVFGMLGLLAGVIRWFLLRGLLPARGWRHVWPVLVMLLGAFMAFCYREAV